MGLFICFIHFLVCGLETKSLLSPFFAWEDCEEVKSQDEWHSFENGVIQKVCNPVAKELVAPVRIVQVCLDHKEDGAHDENEKEQERGDRVSQKDALAPVFFYFERLITVDVIACWQGHYHPSGLQEDEPTEHAVASGDYKVQHHGGVLRGDQCVFRVSPPQKEGQRVGHKHCHDENCDDYELYVLAPVVAVSVLAASEGVVLVVQLSVQRDPLLPLVFVCDEVYLCEAAQKDVVRHEKHVCGKRQKGLLDIKTKLVLTFAA